MSNQIEKQHFYARMAGLSYVVFTLAGFTGNFILDSGIAKVSDFQLGGLFVNEAHFRWGIAAEILMFLAVMTASISFYGLLKSVNKYMAQVALGFRLVEIIVGGMTVVFSMAILALSNKAFLLERFDPEQLHTLVATVASLRLPASEYSWISMGVAGVLTFYMMFKARFVPRFWAVWGMLTYTSLILYPLAKVLVADLPREAMFVMFPGALFELGVGIWLCIFGIKRAVDRVPAAQEA